MSTANATTNRKARDGYHLGLARFPRTLANFRAAVRVLSAVLVYDNDDLRSPYRIIARYAHGELEWESTESPGWWASIHA